MRSIEVLGSKRKLLTTNINILDYDFYNSSNIIILDREKPVVNSLTIKKEYIDIDEQIYKKYSLKSWLEHILI